MGTQRFTATSSLLCGAPALVAVLVSAALVAGGGPAAASSRPSDAGAPRGGPAAGVISTGAGGVGGPARATRVALGNSVGGSAACDVSFGAGHLYIADSGTVRAVNPGTDGLTTPAGTGTANGLLDDGGRATKASLVNACGAVADHPGNLVIA